MYIIYYLHTSAFRQRRSSSLWLEESDSHQLEGHEQARVWREIAISSDDEGGAEGHNSGDGSPGEAEEDRDELDDLLVEFLDEHQHLKITEM